MNALEKSPERVENEKDMEIKALKQLLQTNASVSTIDSKGTSKPSKKDFGVVNHVKASGWMNVITVLTLMAAK